MLASLPPQEGTLMTVFRISEAPEPPTPWSDSSRALLDLDDVAPQRGQYAYAEGRHLEMTFLALPRRGDELSLQDIVTPGPYHSGPILDPNHF